MKEAHGIDPGVWVSSPTLGLLCPTAGFAASWPVVKETIFAKLFVKRVSMPSVEVSWGEEADRDRFAVCAGTVKERRSTGFAAADDALSGVEGAVEDGMLCSSTRHVAVCSDGRVRRARDVNEDGGRVRTRCFQRERLG